MQHWVGDVDIGDSITAVRAGVADYVFEWLKQTPARLGSESTGYHD